MSNGSATRAFPAWAPALGVLIVSFAFFAAMRSQDPLAVDGALRWIDVYRTQSLIIHPNNHILYPANVLAWTTLLGRLGVEWSGPMEFYSAVELMNCVAAAGCLALFAWFAHRATSSWAVALMGCVALGMSKAFVAQATNANEPMVGVLWSMVGVFFAVVATRNRAKWPLIASALVFALGMATYRSTILLAPVAVFLIAQSVEAGERLWARRLARVAAFAAAGVAATALIHGWAYWHAGAREPREFTERFLLQEDARAYFGFSVSRAANMPLGLPRNLVPVMPAYSGMRGLFGQSPAEYGPLLLLTAGLWGFLALCARRLWRQREWLRREQRVAAVAALLGFACTAFPLLAWSPHYDKLWIQPLACLLLFAAVAVSAPKAEKFRGWVMRATFAGIAVAVFWNLAWMIPGRAGEPRELQEARQLAGVVGREDLVIGGWDALSVVYAPLWGEGRFVTFPSEAVRHGIEASRQLHARVGSELAHGRRVYFLALLDSTEPAWDSFLGRRCGVPFSEFDFYRNNSRAVASFATRDGEVVLRELVVDRQLMPRLSAANPN